MVDSLCFLHREHAAEYIDGKEGVMGYRRKWSQEAHGDWEIREIDVIDYSVVDLAKRNEELRQQAITKLSPDEREALGLPRGI
jgi:hypothetical protein